MITELTSHLQKFYLLYQWDKSTDEARLAVLHAFIHYQTQLTIIQDLLQEHLATNTNCWITFLSTNLLLGKKCRVLNNSFESHVYPGTSLSTFAQMTRNPRWVKLLAPERESGQWHWIIPAVFVSFTGQLKNKTKTSCT